MAPPPRSGEQGLLEHERRGRAHSARGATLRGHRGSVGHAARRRPHHEDVGVGGDDLLPDAVLEAGHDGEHHDQRAHPEEHAADADPDEQGQARPVSARPEIAEPEEQLEGQAASPHHGSGAGAGSGVVLRGRPRSGRRCGNRMTSRIDAESAEQHGEPVDADPLPRRRRHAVLEGADVVLVHPLRLVVAPRALGRLLLEAPPLVDGVVELGVGVGQLAAADVQLEPVDQARILALLLGQRRQLDREVGDERRLDEAGSTRLSKISFQSPTRSPLSPRCAMVRRTGSSSPGAAPPRRPARRRRVSGPDRGPERARRARRRTAAAATAAPGGSSRPGTSPRHGRGAGAPGWRTAPRSAPSGRCSRRTPGRTPAS